MPCYTTSWDLTRVSAPCRQAQRDFGASKEVPVHECDATGPTHRRAVATRRADQPSLDAWAFERFACAARWHARIRTQASVSRSRRWHASSSRECGARCISPIGATSRCASASAARGRSRQWLGAVPAAEVRTASRSPSRRSDFRAFRHSSQGPLGPSLRASDGHQASLPGPIAVTRATTPSSDPRARGPLTAMVSTTRKARPTT